MSNRQYDVGDLFKGADDMPKMSRTICYALLALALYSFIISCHRTSHSPMKTGAATEELYKIDFPAPFVNAALTKANVPQEKVDKIISMLQSQHDFIHQKAKEIGAKQSVRNPFDYPPMEDKIADIFHDILFEVYTNVLKSNGIQDDKIIQDSFEYIQQLKIKNYADYLRSTYKSKM
jgi:hypothetical protein